ncbi:RICIN domain-containing protein [Naasia aerilata]|uniref:Fibronectin type-III domain-containing protein n=1 Tax=Naasia aerilata TaxID=1162966 RepID=A0ABM8GCU1_9MICO|nr:RICIN domain-containing protein [Naasia aerilata]BDZ46064.1 hypothetical protein GCM10025866_19730 [Naasia aerilata]
MTLTVTDNAGRTDAATRGITATDTTAPTAPGTPAITSNTGTTVGLNWTASTDNVAVSGYDVYRNGAFVTTTATNSYTDTGRALNTAYSYTIKARDASGNISGSSASTSVTTYPVNTAAWYQVQGVGSGKCLTVGGSADQSGLQIFGCTSPSGTTQKFKFTPTSNGYFTVSVSSAPSLAWDVSGASTADSAVVYMSTLHGGSNQQWKPTPSGASFTLTALNSGKCLDVPNNITNDGTQVQQYTCNTTSAQLWNLVVAP